MKPGASSGAFGLQVNVIKLLFDNPVFASVLTTLLIMWIADPTGPAELFLVMLSAIPKAERSTASPQNLRPISVTNIWYKIVTKVFTQRLSGFLSRLFSAN